MEVFCLEEVVFKFKFGRKIGFAQGCFGMCGYRIQHLMHWLRRVLVILFLSFSSSACNNLSPVGYGHDQLLDVNLDSDVESGSTANAGQDGFDISLDRGLDTKTSMAFSTRLEPISSATGVNLNNRSEEPSFSVVGGFSISTENMPTYEFIQYVFGDLLEFDLVIDPAIREFGNVSDLRIEKDLSAQDLFSLSVQILSEGGVQIDHKEGVLYISSNRSSQRAIIGIGNRVEDVPLTNQEILQIVPVLFGTRVTIERTLNQLLDVSVLPDADRNSFFLRGGRESIIKALELIHILDTPAFRGKYISIIRPRYAEISDLTAGLVAVLNTEGIEAVERSGSLMKNLTFVPLPSIEALAIFGTSELLVDRAEYWAGMIDKAPDRSEKRFYVFTPKFAKAEELYEGVQGLLAGSFSSNSVVGPEGDGSTGYAPSRERRGAINTPSMDIVVDKVSNSLLINSTWGEYQGLLDLLGRMDTLPRQVYLDVIIAEVSLKDEFRQGVEWALSKNGLRYSSLGAFGATSFAGLEMLYEDGGATAVARMLSTNSLVKIISNPSMLVRDGVTAQINVGSDIAVIGDTTIDPINGQRQTVSTVYRKTGVDVSITPSISTSNIVTMDITQTISNSVPGSSGAGGNPDIFERALATQVVARSGQTVLLAGLKSRDLSTGGSGIPILKDIPILGRIASSNSDSASETELVMLITARVLSEEGEWESILSDFSNGLQRIQFQGNLQSGSREIQ